MLNMIRNLEFEIQRLEIKREVARKLPEYNVNNFKNYERSMEISKYTREINRKRKALYRVERALKGKDGLERI
jgi:hypothetical protein